MESVGKTDKTSQTEQIFNRKMNKDFVVNIKKAMHRLHGQ